MVRLEKMIYALNFADEKYKKAQQLNTKTAYKYGADKVFEYSWQDIDKEFYEQNRQILVQERGKGYWLWKPYFIYKTLMLCGDGDWVVYADSGTYYRKNIKTYIEGLEKEGIEFISRTTKFKEKEFTKRDVFIELGCDSPYYTDSLQRAASVILIKNIPHNRQIIEEWLGHAQNIHWITDEPNHCGEENYKEFIDHRHDQSLFSLVCKKYNVAYNKNLFMDMAFFYKKGALLTDHHTRHGNYVSAYLGTIRRVMKMMYGIVFKE